MIAVIKQECVNHVAKRLGTRLRKLKVTEVEIKKTKTGKTMCKSFLDGKDKLTDKVIDRLTFYYGCAIRHNVGKSIESMKKDIQASFYHCSSSDEDPQHHLCPEGEESWSYFKKAQASNETPKSHKEMSVYFRLEKADLDKVMAVYTGLSKEELMKKSIERHTQNPNEAIHAKLWANLPKIKYTGLKTTLYSLAHTIMVHNFGYEDAAVTAELGFGNIPEAAAKVLQKQDKIRKRKSLSPSVARVKRRRQEMPGPSYEAGAF